MIPNEERLLKVLLEPHLSEKTASTAGQYSQYAFKVMPDATKSEIKKAVEHLFKVAVRSVRTVNMKSKTARFGRTLGRHSAWKKAYVMLAEGQTIDTSSVG